MKCDMDLIGKSIRLSLILSIFLAFPLESVVTASSIKHPPQVVMGTIEEVTPSSIRINGKYYDIYDADILSVRGIALTRDQLQPGGEVEIRFEDNKAMSVIVKNKHYFMQ